jgi:ATP-dependent RNA helicase RhlE
MPEEWRTFERPKPLTDFTAMGLVEPLTRALADEGYTTPTPIQSQTIPLALEGRDVMGIAQTGTGKTAAFVLPILQRLSSHGRRPEKKTCRALILAPTRELAGQILDSVRAYGRYQHLSATLAIGGVPMPRQVKALANGVDILVATPGRLLDLVKGNALRLRDVTVLVLDEADRMLDMGFVHDIRKIVTLVPKVRQTLFFSATMPPAIAELTRAMLTDPAHVAVTPVASTAERIDQRVEHISRGDKPARLAALLLSETIDRAIVFTRTKHGADKVVRGLEKSGIQAAAIHGNKSQSQREKVLAAFRTGAIRTLIATDIAARGIDVDGISHVFNYDLPNEPEAYVHRIGRTARAGAEGIAISFCDGEERAFLRGIERLIGRAITATGTPQGGGGAPREPQGRPQHARPTQGKPGGRPGGRQQRRPDTRGDSRSETRGEGRLDARHEARGDSRQEPRARAKHGTDQRRPARTDAPRERRDGQAGGAIGAVAFLNHPAQGRAKSKPAR